MQVKKLLKKHRIITKDIVKSEKKLKKIFKAMQDLQDTIYLKIL